jgi:NAD(P)-dependent dehydrogenase (short-subunit alcohol dehydrogenase family)
MKLANKLAVVTGASQGLGLAIVHRVVQGSARVLLCARTASDPEGPRKGPKRRLLLYTDLGRAC